jgi:integrase
MTLKQTVDDYLKEKAQLKQWSANSTTLHTGTLKNLLAVYGGQTQVVEIDRAAGARFAKFVADRLSGDGDVRWKPRTAQAELSRAAQFGHWLVRKGVIERNPLHDILPVKIANDPDEEARAFTTTELQQLAPDILEQRESKPERYAVTLISLYSGLRVGEVTLLNAEDVREVDGVLCFDLSQKKLKTVLSRGYVPVHPLLRNVLPRVGSGPLFPGLKSSTISSWFHNLLKRRGWKTVKSTEPGPAQHVTFHSCRRSFASRLVDLDVSDAVVQDLLRHSPVGGKITGKYIGRRKPPLLAVAVEKLTYDWPVEHQLKR